MAIAEDFCELVELCREDSLEDELLEEANLSGRLNTFWELQKIRS